MTSLSSADSPAEPGTSVVTGRRTPDRRTEDRKPGAPLPYRDGVTKSQHAGVTRVVEALAAAGATGEVVELADEVRTAALAARALGVEVGAIANSLVFDADGEPLLVLTSGAHRVDTAKVAALVGVRKLGRATPEFVRAATGQPIGGVAPVGHPAPLRTLVDVLLAEHDVVWASGGIPHVVFATSYEELVRITGGTPAEVG
jgi:prolyl-tRNA editing enzyme YbaK/EbsC (Cys-tRNA(Pro) deacylase)